MSTNDGVSESHDGSGVPAGWYPDGSGGQRWWNGSQWTEHVRPAAAQAQPTAASQEPLAPGGAEPPKPRRTGLLVTGIVVGALLLIGVTVGGIALAIASVNAVSGWVQSSASSSGSPSASPELPTAPDDDDDDLFDDSPDYEDIFLERERFFADQGLPLDGSQPVATTPAQLAFVAEARADIEQNSGTWDAQSEAIVLSLAVDACETSILNAHEVDETTVRMHAASSPLIEALTQGATGTERAQATTGLMGLAVTGTSYLCPADHAQWAAAASAIGDSW